MFDWYLYVQTKRSGEWMVCGMYVVEGLAYKFMVYDDEHHHGVK